MRFNPSLFALAAGAFGIGVTEFAPMGMLPLIAADLHISIPVAGLLVSAYAVGVMVGAPLMTLTTGRIDRRTVLIGLMGIFTAGSLLSALAGGYWMLLAALGVRSTKGRRLSHWERPTRRLPYSYRMENGKVEALPRLPFRSTNAINVPWYSRSEQVLASERRKPDGLEPRLKSLTDRTC